MLIYLSKLCILIESHFIDSCITAYPNIAHSCNSDYKIYLEDRKDYSLSWLPTDADNGCCSELIDNAFKYKSIYELKVLFFCYINIYIICTFAIQN